MGANEWASCPAFEFVPTSQATSTEAAEGDYLIFDEPNSRDTGIDSNPSQFSHLWNLDVSIRATSNQQI